MGALPVLAIVAAAGVRLSVQTGTGCDLEGTLAPALQKIGVSVSGELARQVSVTAVEGGLAVTLVDGAGAMQGFRRLAISEADCAVVPQSIAMLIKSWLGTALAVETPAPRRRMTRAPPAPAPEPMPAAELESPESEVQPEPQPPEPTPPPLPQPLTLPLPLPIPEVAQRPRRTLGVQVSGGLGIDSQALAHLSAVVSIGIREPWGVAVDFGTESPRSNGPVQAMFWGGGVWARRAFHFFDGSLTGLYVSLGARLLALRASTFLGASTDRVTAAVAAQVEWRQMIVKGLFASVGVSGQVRLWEERIAFGDPRIFTSTMVIPPASGYATIGVGWIFP